MVRDPLSDMVRALDLTGAVFLEGRLTAPWSIAAKVSPDDCRPFMEIPERVIAYHVVTRGRMTVTLGGDTREVGEGAIVLLPRNDLHTVASEPGLPPDELELLRAGDGRFRIDHGGGGAETRILCGFLASDAASTPLLDSLPRLLTLALDDLAALEWVESSVRMAVRELARGRLASAAVTSRLAELLFVEALRRFIEAGASPSGWLAGMRDPRIGRALALVHADLAKPWTVDTLAASAGMSRSAFADRFARLVGASPIRYLADARLAAARALLRETRLTAAEVGYRVGYEAPVAFNRAFRRAFGAPPAAWRERDRP
jgi:AraC-like DNA-binding protein